MGTSQLLRHWQRRGSWKDKNAATIDRPSGPEQGPPPLPVEAVEAPAPLAEPAEVIEKEQASAPESVPEPEAKKPKRSRRRKRNGEDSEE